ncbi:hypothetical protein [Carbonactinospora thermoautotrophica]|nr:hypothetical protein [Carbonactinospora thermoautotrophica]
MSVPTVSGAPGVVAFPEEAARTVVEYAQKAGQTIVIKIIDEIRNWLGHPEIVNDHVHAWSPTIKQLFTDSQYNLSTCKAELSAYWEGPGYESFKAYSEHISKVFENAADIADKMSGLLRQVNDTITKVYQEAVRFIGDCAVAIIKASESILGEIEKLWLGVARGVLVALQEFVQNISNLTREVMGILNSFRSNAQELQNRAVDLKLPDVIPPSATLPDNWIVRPRKNSP